MHGRSLPMRTESVAVWDLFVRVFHWCLVGCVLLNYFVLSDGKTLHQALGYMACALVAGRVVWGFTGSRHARFAAFAPTPTRLRAHVQAWRAGQPLRHEGHNPVGAVMMLALMGCVSALGLTGWLQTTDRFWGEEWLQDIHEALGHGLIVMAGLHASAAIVMGHLERTNLVQAMVTGTKVFRR